MRTAEAASTLVVLAALVLPAAASGGSGFGPAVPLPWLDRTSQLEFAQGAPGEAIIAGATRDGDLSYPQVAVAGPDRVAPVPERLAESATTGPVLATNRSGRAVVAWTSQPDETTNALHVATREPGGDFNTFAAIPSDARGLVVRNAAMNSSGDAVVIFQSSGNSNDDYAIDALFLPAGGGAPQRVKVADGTNNAWGMSVAYSEAGTVTVAWADYGRLDGRLQVADGDAAHGFRAPQVIDSTPLRGEKLALDADGRAVLEWESGEQSDVMVARREPGELFSDPVTLGSSGQGAGAQMAVTDAGRVLVMWTGGIVGGDPTDSMSYARIAEGDTRGGAFTRFYNAWNGSVGDLLLPVLATAPDGYVAIARYPYRWFGGPAGGHEVLITGGPVADGFGVTHEIACPEAPAGAPAGLVLSGPDDMSLLLSQSGESGFTYSLVRSVPGTPPGPESCSPPIEVTAPSAVRKSALPRLTLSVVNALSGRVTVTGAVKRGGRTLRKFVPVHWRAAHPQTRAVHLRLKKRLGLIGRKRVTATITVLLEASDGTAHRKTTRIRVKR